MGSSTLPTEARIVVAPARHARWVVALVAGQLLWVGLALLAGLILADPLDLYVHDNGFWLGGAFTLAVAALIVAVFEQVRRVLRGATPVLVARRTADGRVAVERPPLFPVQPRLTLAVVGRTGVGYITAPRARGTMAWWTRFALVIASPEGSIGTPLPWALDSASIDAFVAFLAANGIEAARADATGLAVSSRSSRARRRE